MCVNVVSDVGYRSRLMVESGGRCCPVDVLFDILIFESTEFMLRSIQGGPGQFEVRYF